MYVLSVLSTYVSMYIVWIKPLAAIWNKPSIFMKSCTHPLTHVYFHSISHWLQYVLSATVWPTVSYSQAVNEKVIFVAVLLALDKL